MAILDFAWVAREQSSHAPKKSAVRSLARGARGRGRGLADMITPTPAGQPASPAGGTAPQGVNRPRRGSRPQPRTASQARGHSPAGGTGGRQKSPRPRVLARYKLPRRRPAPGRTPASRAGGVSANGHIDNKDASGGALFYFSRPAPQGVNPPRQQPRRGQKSPRRATNASRPARRPASQPASRQASRQANSQPAGRQASTVNQ